MLKSSVMILLTDIGLYFSDDTLKISDMIFDKMSDPNDVRKVESPFKIIELPYAKEVIT